MKIPFFLVTGFLGSGKTTLLKQFIDQYADDKKIAVVQNEFAPASIDGTDLKQTGKSFEILEVNQGSVFCVCLLSDFINSLSDFILEHKPDAVILEASGLSDPIAIAEMLQSDKLRSLIYLSHIWSVVDSENFIKLEKMQTRLQHQIRVADKVILNKIDLAKDNVGAVKERVVKLNPYAKIFETSFCDTSFDGVFSEFILSPVAISNAEDNAGFESCGKPEINVSILKTTRKITRENLDIFLKEVTPGSYRLKGYVLLNSGDNLVVQSVFGKNELTEIETYQGPTELIIMSDNITFEEFNNKFKALAT